MGFSVKGIDTEFIGDYITVKAASKFSGYSDQYKTQDKKNRSNLAD